MEKEGGVGAYDLYMAIDESNWQGSNEITENRCVISVDGGAFVPDSNTRAALTHGAELAVAQRKEEKATLTRGPHWQWLR